MSLKRILDRIRHFEHRAHHFQILLAIIVASLILTWALLSQRGPVLDPKNPQVALAATP